MRENGRRISLLTALLLAYPLGAEELPVALESVNIETEVVEEDPGVGTTNVVSAEEIELFGSSELLNPYKAISLEPGVDIRNQDPFGMEITHKIRGKSDRNIGETLEGLPLKGIGPGAGLSTMVDLENISSIRVEKGAIRADGGFGYGSDNGMVDMRMQAPARSFSATLKQVMGTEKFSKSYLRVDTGDIGGVARMFVSGSVTKADKFKGEGESPDRKNVAVGIASQPSQPITWEFYGIYNDEKKHKYWGLNYTQSQDLSTYWDFDYNSELTGDPAEDAYYYDYNRQHFRTFTVFGKVNVLLSAEDSVTLRPYFLNDEGYSYSGSGGKLIDWLVDHNTYGMVAEYERKWDRSRLKAGYWYQEDEPPGPPTSRKIRDTELNFVKWERIIGVEKNHRFSAPFLSYELAFGSTVIDAGVKYLWLSSPHLVSYNTKGIGDVSYATALSQVKSVDFELPSNTYEVFLPTLGVTHFLNEGSSVKASYGRNYNTPSYGFGGSMISYFNSAAVDKNETILQRMWADLKPEESDNIDVGYTYTSKSLSLTTTLYYSLVKNVGGTFYDPSLGFYYQQNTAEARSYGLELGAGYHVSDALDIDGAFTYNNYAFTSDIQTATGSAIRSKGNQLPDVPQIYGNISARYATHGFTFAPVVRYLGRRYVDVENKYSVDPYILADLTITKRIGFDDGGTLDISLSGTNLTDKKYIATISTSETNVAEDGPTYIVGAPRAVFVSMQYRY